MGRHMRRMRELFLARLTMLRSEGEKQCKGLMGIPTVKAGLYTAGFLRDGMSSRQAESAPRINRTTWREMGTVNYS